MPYRRRRFKSKTCYEICFRAREGLPFVALRFLKLIIKSALARTLRDDKVTLSHFIFNGSHCHLIVVSKDVVNLKRFYEELQKRITDAIKRILGAWYLNLWESRTSVIEIADLEAAKERIAYLYANPAQDDLEDSIERFPGYSSWQEYTRSMNVFDARLVERVPWIRLPTIDKLPDHELSDRDDDRLTRLLRSRNKQAHNLTIEPNAWMGTFGVVTDRETAEVNKSIVSKLRSREGIAGERRQKEGRTSLGRKRLKRQLVMTSHTPKKKDRKIFVISSCRELRMKLIDEMKAFCEKCAECYKLWKSGNYDITWPLGAFKPPSLPLVNPLPV